MESLSYALEGRTLLFTDDTDFPIDGLVRNKHLLRKWDGEDEVGSFEFMEPLLPNMVKKQLPGNQSSVDHKNDYSAQSASTLSSNSLMEFGSRFSSSLNKANDEKFVAPVESNGNPFSVDNSVLSSPEPSISAKRSRLTNVQSPVPTCQVFGCNKDLSSSKDYHKRHKVCDVHSKTPVVIVNGIQQRFCQQCSRFHLLAEFDEGKRSCRKRLAGHNERRRKPQFDAHLGSSYFSTGESKTSLIFSRVLPGGFFDLQYNEPSNHSTSLGLEDNAKCGQSLPKSTLSFHGVGKQYPSKNCLNAPSSSLEEFSVSSDTSSALSLLSAGSHNLSRNSEGILMAHPLISQQNRHANSLFSENLATTHLGGSCTSEHLTPFIPNSFETPQTPLTQEPNALNLKSNPSNTVNLLELSLHLQRVEQQKYHGQVKLENGIFCDSTIT